MEGGITLPPWAAVLLAVGLPVLTLVGRAALGVWRANRHEDRQDHDQVYNQQASTITAMQVRHDHLSQLVEEQGMRHVREMQVVLAKQAACEEKHQDCEEKYESLQKRVKELEEAKK